MPLVDIDSVGVVEFPDSMSAEEINAAGEQIYTQARRATPGLQPQVAEQPLALPQDTGVGRQMQNWLNPAPLPRVDSDAAQQVARTYEAAISLAQDSNRRDSIPKLQEEYRAAMQSLGVTPLSSPEASLMDPLVSLRDRTPSAQTVQDAVDVLASYTGGTEEEKDYLRAGPSAPPDKTAQGVSGGLRAVAGAGEFLTSPLGVATMGTAAAPKWAQKLITMGFTMDMLRHTPELADRFGAATVSGDAQAQVETLGDLLINSLFVVSGATHSLPASAPVRPPLITVEMSRRLAKQLLDAQLEGRTREDLAGMAPRRELVAERPQGGKWESGKVGGENVVPPPIEDLPAPVEQKAMRAKAAPEVNSAGGEIVVGTPIEHPMVGMEGTVPRQMTTGSEVIQRPVTIESISHGEPGRTGRPTVDVVLSDGKSVSVNYGKDKFGGEVSLEEAIQEAVVRLKFTRSNGVKAESGKVGGEKVVPPPIENVPPATEITGSNVQKGTEMPAEVGESPIPEAPRAKTVRELPEVPAFPEPLEGQPYEPMAKAMRAKTAPEAKAAGGKVGEGESGQRLKDIADQEARVASTRESQAAFEQRNPNPAPAKAGIISGGKLEAWADGKIAEGQKLGITPGKPDPALLAAYVVKGAAMVERGVRKFADWAQAMLREHGDEVRPYLRDIWDQVQEFVNTRSDTAFEPGGTATSIRNATVDVERQQRGLPPAMEPLKRSFGQVWDEAMARLDQDPGRAERLVAELKEKPRAVSDLEDALLLHRQVELQNRYARYTRELAQAYDDARSFPNRLAEVEEFKALVAEVSDQLLELYNVSKLVGTETSRGLNARKMLAQEDFTLASMELAKREANGGAPLTEAQRAELVAAHEKIAALEKAFNEAQARAEEALAGRRAAEAVAELEKKAAAANKVEYSSKVLRKAEEIVGSIELMAVDASARLREKLRRMNTGGADPTILYDLGVVGAAKIARFGLDKAKLIEAMVKEFGEKVREWENEIWTVSNERLDAELAKYGNQSPAVKRLRARQNEQERQGNIVEAIRKAVADNQPLPLLGDYVRKLAESLLRSGVKGREALVTAVHDVLKAEFDPNITRREAMDAISGYGNFRSLNPDAIKAELRDLKGQMQQVAKLEDIQARQPLPKSGVERRVPSDEERRLIQQVNEAKRRFGVVVSDPARQLKSALDAVKTRLKNQIADIEFQIATKARTVKTKTPAPFDTESRLLETRRDALQQELDELLPRPEMTDAQRLSLAQRNVERSIAMLEERIAKRDIGPDGKKRAPVGSPALDALKARREALRAEWELLRDSLDPGRRERLELSTLKARLRAQEAHYAERLARGDFAPRPKREVRMDEEALRLKAQMEMAREKWRQGLEVDRLRHRTVLHKVGHNIRELLNIPRSWLSSWDVSAVLRQGGFLALSHPVRAARSLGPMFRALASETRAAMVDQEILSRPNAPRYARAKLYLAPLETTRLSTMEEAFMSRVAKALPGVKASNRAFVTFLNKLRADSFDAMVDRFEARGPKLTDAEMQAVANYINVATGRGDMGRAAAAAETLATVFFSPRLVTSRFQLLAGQPMWRGSARTRMAVAAEYARFLGALGVVYALGNMAGADVEDDPRSSDFGKLRFGDTRVDPLGGLAQATVLLGRVGSGETKNAQGQVRPIRGDLPFGEQTTADVLGRFLRSKLSPVVGGALDAMSGEDVIGDPVTAGSLAQRMVIPLSMQEIYEVMKAQGVAKGTALGVLSLFGMGLQQRPNADVEKVVGYVMGKMKVPPSETEKVRAVLRRQFAADPSTPAQARQLRQLEEDRYQTRQRMAQPTPRATP